MVLFFLVFGNGLGISLKRKNTNMSQTEASSFRDPSGHVFYKKGQIFRHVNFSYRSNYEKLISSGLYNKLSKFNFLISHIEALNKDPNVYKILKPQKIPFVSYPHEWCFTQLKKAALLTLKIQKIALDHDMILKDSSAFNVQFVGKNPIFIDTLSFDIYQENLPWIAYRQFCRHFLAPLVLMSYVNPRLNSLFSNHLDGIPLDLAVSMLPFRAKLNPGIFAHLCLNSTSQQLLSKNTENIKKYKLSKHSLYSLIFSLRSTIKNLKPKSQKTLWGKYYTHTNYQHVSFSQKKILLSKYLKNINRPTVLDLGGNTGVFSRLISNSSSYVVSADFDTQAIEENCRQNKSSNILPLVIDLFNPSPALGWANTERKSFWQRGNFDVILMLAVVHHLAIGNNLPFENIASFICTKCKYLIIEFIGKQDSQVKILLSHRQDIFTSYSQKSFEEIFGRYFTIKRKNHIAGSHRFLYLMEKK